MMAKYYRAIQCEYFWSKLFSIVAVRKALRIRAAPVCAANRGVLPGIFHEHLLKINWIDFAFLLRKKTSTYLTFGSAYANQMSVSQCD